MRILVTGASGQLGAYLIERLAESDHHILPRSGSQPTTIANLAAIPLDLTDLSHLESELNDANPDVIVHLAAISSAAEVLKDPARARLVNVEATRRMGKWTSERQKRLIFTSTDMVFSGDKPWQTEDDEPNPVLEYGRTKREAERAVFGLPGVLILRLALMYGPSKNGRVSFFDQALNDIRQGKPRTFFNDEFRTPLFLGAAAQAIAQLINHNAVGILHLAGTERMSRFELMQRCATEAGLDASLVRANSRLDSPGQEPRPADVSLDTSRLQRLLRDAN